MIGIGWVGAMLWRGVPVFISRNGVEVFLDNLFSPRKSIASAHWEITADRMGVTLNGSTHLVSPPHCPCSDGHGSFLQPRRFRVALGHRSVAKV
jgi:hypothetical protein